MIIKINYFFLLIALFSIGEGLKAQCYELLWADEFDYTGFPDAEYWTFEVGGDGWGNSELQYYKANDEDNSWVENGSLKITAIKETYGGRNYTSARILTREKFNFQYGKIEASLKLPYGQGIWPAFWIMGESISDVGWPACGEIDIMEMVGGDNGDNEIHGTAHWDNEGSHAQYGGSYSLSGGIFADTFHTFTVEWDPSSIRWFLDGQQFHVLSITSAGLSEFHNDFFILLNLAVGGRWPGDPDQSTVFPQTLEVDYIRVYKSRQQINAMEINGDDKLPAKAAKRTFYFPGSPDWVYDWLVPEDAEITNGQGTENIEVNWGCNDGKIICNVTGICGSYIFEKDILVQNEIYAPMFISPGEEDVLFYTDSLTGSAMLWKVPPGAFITEGQGTDSVYVSWGDNFEKVELMIDNSCGTTQLEFIPIIAGQYPYPELEKSQKIPGIIEAVNYDYGGEGIAYHDLSSWNEGPGPRQDEHVDTEYNDNGNPNVGWIQNGEWLEFTVSVESASFYKASMRVATANSSGGPFSVLFNEEEKLSGISVPGTGAWDAFTTINAGTLYLDPADTLMRLNFNVGNFNLGKITFTPTEDPAINVPFHSTQVFSLYPQPASYYLTLKSKEEMNEYSIVDLKGRLIRKEKLDNLFRKELDIREISPGVYFIYVKMMDGEVHHKKLIKVQTIR
jgi:beta-glucanase (GH16 family)